MDGDQERHRLRRYRTTAGIAPRSRGSGAADRARMGHRRRRLPQSQRLDSRPRHEWASGDGVRPRRRVHDRLGRRSRLRRYLVRARRRRPGHRQLPTRGRGLPRTVRWDHEHRIARSDRSTALGARQHRRVRRGPGQRHLLRRIGWRLLGRVPAALPAGRRTVPASDRPERTPLQPEAARTASIVGVSVSPSLRRWTTHPCCSPGLPRSGRPARASRSPRARSCSRPRPSGAAIG
jgi:hypothetical protein